jgi:hypothetical protein
MNKQKKYFNYILKELLNKVEYDDRGTPHFNIKERQIVFGDVDNPVEYFFNVNIVDNYWETGATKDFIEYVQNMFGVRDNEVHGIWKTFTEIVRDRQLHYEDIYYSDKDDDFDWYGN